MTPRRGAAALLAVALSCATHIACDYLEPDVGEPLVARCTSQDTDPSAEVSFQRDIRPILRREAGGCVPCHEPGSSNPIGVTLGGLDLTSWTELRQGGARSGGTIVVEGDPCASVLYLKLGPGPPFGDRMPMDGPPYLSALELSLVHDWIAEGARDN